MADAEADEKPLVPMTRGQRQSATIACAATAVGISALTATLWFRWWLGFARWLSPGLVRIAFPRGHIGESYHSPGRMIR